MTRDHPPEERWVGLLEGSLPFSERAALDAHASACPACAAERDEIREGMALLAARAPRSSAAPPLPALRGRRWTIAAIPGRIGGWVPRFRGSGPGPAAAPPPSDRYLARPSAATPGPRAGGESSFEGPGVSRSLSPPPLAGEGQGVGGRRIRFVVPLAAAAAAAVAIGAWWLGRPATAGTVAWVRGGEAPGAGAGSIVRAGQEIAAPEGVRLGLKLGNGVEAAWNRGTRARVQSAREIALTQGELHVRVPPAARGFAVSTPDGRIVDLGTAFLLRVAAAGTEVHVLAGSVRVESRGRSFDLKDGERASLRPGARPAAVPAAETDRALGWVRDAIFPGDFRQTPVPELLDLLESVSALRFDYDRAAASGHTVTASLSGASSDAIAEGLFRSLGWHVQRAGWRWRVHVPGP